MLLNNDPDRGAKNRRTTRKREKTKALFIGNIFLRLGQSKNAGSLWSD